MAFFVVAVLMAPTAGVIVDTSRLHLPAVAFEHPGVRLQAMVTAADAVPLASASIGSLGVRVGPNVQVFDNRQPQNEIAIAASPANARNLVIGSNDYRLRDLGASVWVGVYTSTDGGRSWKAQLIPGHPGGPPGVLSTYGFGGDPIVGFDRIGRAYAGGIFFRGTPLGADIRDVSIFVSRSDDGGLTWNEPTAVALGKAESLFHDHPQMAVDATGGPHDGNVYVSWTRFVGVGRIDILVATSRDGGASWSTVQVSGPIPPGDAAAFYQDSMVAVGPNGEVYAVWDEAFLDPGAISRTKIWMAVSKDGGRTFSAPFVVDADVATIALPNAGYRHDSYPAAAADSSEGPNRGRLYLTWSDQRSGDADILLKHSDDGGTTWSSPVRVNDDAGTAAQLMQWVTVDPGGRVFVSFYDRRDDPNDYLERVCRGVDGRRRDVHERAGERRSLGSCRVVRLHRGL